MSKYEAVDRLMEMATEKRADPVAPVLPGNATAAGSVTAEPGEVLAVEGAGSRARRILSAAKPLLPAMAGAMRQADHGALQALGRLLPMLGQVLNGAQVLGAVSPPAARGGAESEFSRSLIEVQELERALRKTVDDMVLKQATAEEEVRRLRTQQERLYAEHQVNSLEIRKLAERLRLVTAGAIILLMLLVAQVVVVAVVLHR